MSRTEGEPRLERVARLGGRDAGPPRSPNSRLIIFATHCTCVHWSARNANSSYSPLTLLQTYIASASTTTWLPTGGAGALLFLAHTLLKLLFVPPLASAFCLRPSSRAHAAHHAHRVHHRASTALPSSDPHFSVPSSRQTDPSPPSHRQTSAGVRRITKVDPNEALDKPNDPKTVRPRLCSSLTRRCTAR